MATYIQGVTGYVPQIQPFQPDFNFLGNILQTKQSRYDAAKKQLSSVYGTLLNSPLTHQDNIKARDAFFKSIEQDIQKMSGMDLSLEQNVDQALNIFKGLYEDQYIVKDMAYTKNYMNQKDRGEMLKLCTDKKKCGGSWWEGGDRYLDYKRQEFAKAPREKTLNIKDASYVAAQNFTEDAIKAAEEAKFKVTYDEIKGDYIVTTTNGSEMVGSLAEFYVSKFGQDAKVMEYLKASAYLKRKDWVNQNLANYNNDDNEANLAYISQIYGQSLQNAENDKTKTDKELEIVKAKSNLIDKTIKEDGYLESSGWLDSWLDVKGEEPVIEQKKQIYDKNYDNLKALGINKDNIEFMLDSIDNNVALSFLKQESLNAASIYANNTMERSFKANEVALRNKDIASREKLAREREGYIVYNPITKQNEYVPGTDHMSKLEIKKFEAEHEKKMAKEAAERNRQGYTPKPEEGGASTGNLWDLGKVLAKGFFFGQTGKDVAKEKNIQKLNENTTEINTMQKQMINEVVNAGKNAFTGEKATLQEIVPAVYDIAKAAGINILDNKKDGYVDIQKLISGDVEQSKRFEDALNKSGNLEKAYQAARAVSNPNSYSGSLYKKWAGSANEVSNAISYKYNDAIEMRQALTEFTQKQGKIALQKYNAEIDALAYKEELDTNDNIVTPLRQLHPGVTPTSEVDLRKGFINQLLEKAAVNGIMPNKSDIVGAIQYLATESDDKTGKLATTPSLRLGEMEEIEGLDKPIPISSKARQIANLIKNFAKENEYYFDHTEALEKNLGFGPTTLQAQRNPYENAIAFLAKNVGKDFDLYNHAYRENASSWDNLEGGKTTGMKGMVLSTNFDAADLGSIGAQDFFEFSKAMDLAGDKAIVTYGNFVEAPEESNSDARKILNQLRVNMAEGSPVSKDGIPTKSDRALGNIEIAGIAAHNPNLVAFRVYPGTTWGEKFTSTDSKTRIIPKDDAMKYNEDGIVVFLPKETVPQRIIDKFETTNLDFIMQQKGSITIDNPMGGKATLSKEGLGYRLNMGVVKIDPQTSKPYLDMTTSYQGPDLDLAGFKESFEKDFDYLSYINTQTLQQVAQENGIKDPNALFRK